MVGGRGWRLMGGKRAGIYVHSQPPAANTTCPGDRNREQLFISDDSIVVCWLDTIVPYEMEPRADGMLEEEEEHSSKKEGDSKGVQNGADVPLDLRTHERTIPTVFDKLTKSSLASASASAFSYFIATHLSLCAVSSCPRLFPTLLQSLLVFDNISRKEG